MKNILYIIGLIILANMRTAPLLAQSEFRYCTEIFPAVQVQKDVTYGSNISILTGAPAAIDLLADVYTPEGDNVTDRPVILEAHRHIPSADTKSDHFG